MSTLGSFKTGADKEELKNMATEELKKKIGGGLIRVFLTLLIIPVSVFFYSYAMSKIWGWFIAPVFSLPTLSIMQAYGCALFVFLFSKKPSFKEFQQSLEDKRNRETIYYTNIQEFLSYTLGFSVIAPLCATGWGWLIHHFFFNQ